MELSEIIDNPIKSLNYLERYVNDGSPSGFTTKYTASIETNPFSDFDYFNLYMIEGSSDSFKDFGHIPKITVNKEVDNNNKYIFLHPDTYKKLNFSKKFKVKKINTLKVTPTASTRTVKLLSENYYLKLHYEGILGRVNRQLPYKKAIAGCEVSNELKKHIYDENTPDKFSFFEEVGTRVLIPKENGIEIGMIYRNATPTGKKVNDIYFTLPFFSLFSKDKQALEDELLLNQIIKKSNSNDIDYILNELIFPILDSYFYLIKKHGFIPEVNAQNLLIGFDENFNVSSLIFRDLQRFEKDYTIRKNIGLEINFKAYPYKVICSDDKDYTIRHSFSFDFKLSEYIIEPLLKLINIDNYNNLQNTIKNYVNNIIKDLPKCYFPTNKWYKHDKILLTNERPYIELINPKFR